jgi:mono/diheme cytochrome c family protein
MRRAAAVIVALLLTALPLACGGGETTTPEPEAVEGSVSEETTATVGEGDPAAGEEVFKTANPACGSCHTFEAAGATGTVGPDLDEVLQGKDAEFIHESIVNPDAEIADGYQPGIMPKTYGQDLSEKQLADLVAFLKKS